MIPKSTRTAVLYNKLELMQCICSYYFYSLKKGGITNS